MDMIVNGETITLAQDKVAEFLAGQEAINLDPSVPDTISRRQFYQQLANRRLISRDEALAAIVSNALPSEFAAMVDEIINDDIRWQAKMLLAGASNFERTNWFVGFFASMKSLSNEFMDDFWRDAFQLD